MMGLNGRIRVVGALVFGLASELVGGMASITGTEHAPGRSSRAIRYPQRKAPEDERKRRHQNRSQTQARSLQRSVHERTALLESLFGKFDD